MSDKDELAGDIVADGDHCEVRMTVRVQQEYGRWPPGVRAAMERTLEILAEDGHMDLPPCQFRPEERLKVSGTKKSVMIYAVKDQHFRLYGAYINGTFFVCSGFDDAKKQQKADRDKLQRAADRLRRIILETKNV